MRTVMVLFRREWMIDSRSQHNRVGIFLFCLASVYVCYLNLNTVEVQINTLLALWGLTGLFGAFHAMQKAILSETAGHLIYLHSLASPLHIMWSKLLYQMIWMSALNLVNGLLLFFFFNFTLPTWIHPGELLLAWLLISTGTAATLNFIGSISQRAGNSATLLALLGFPVMIPILITANGLLQEQFQGMTMAQSGLHWVTLVILNLVPGLLSTLLFPYLWRD